MAKAKPIQYKGKEYQSLSEAKLGHPELNSRSIKKKIKSGEVIFIDKPEEEKTEKQCAMCNEIFPLTEQYFGKPRRHKRNYGKQDYLYFRAYCLDCQRKRKRESAQRNRETNINRSKAWYEENKERVSREKRKQYWTDSEYRAAAIQRAMEYQGSHPYELKARTQRRRERYLEAEGEITPEIIEQLYEEQNGYCAYCGQDTHADFHIDHIIPLSRGGTNLKDNLCVACPKCNLSKGDKLLSEWPLAKRWYTIEK